MEPACLASKRQASSKQATPAGPMAGPRATGVPKSRKKCYHAIRNGVETTNNPLWDPGPGRQSAPCARVAVPGAGPRWGPKRAQNHQKRAPVPPWEDPEGSVVQVDGQNQLGYYLGRLWDPCGPETVSVGPKMGSFGPRMCPAG